MTRPVKMELERIESAGPPVPSSLRRSANARSCAGVFGGLANKEIAHNLGVSEPLVKSVIQQLFTKTGVRSRTQLVRIAVERYWDELEEE